MTDAAYRASEQWRSRPDDERFTSLDDMISKLETVKNESRGVVVSSNKINVLPTETGDIQVIGTDDVPYDPTHWSFGQIAQLSESSARYLRTLHPQLAAACMAYKLKFVREIESVGLLLRNNGDNTLRAATGPNYGRIWSADFVRMIRQRFGNGVDGDWRVPGEFGQEITVHQGKHDALRQR